MQPLIQTLAAWHEFYSLLGTASATMVGLLFVAASVGSGAFTKNRTAALRVFLSASVVHFSSILAASLIVLAPIQTLPLLGVMISTCGLFGLAYSGLAWRGTVLDGLSTSIDVEDRAWYVVLPVIAYLLETGSGIALAIRLDMGSVALAFALAFLLVVGIHNAWDITIWSITRRRE